MALLEPLSPHIVTSRTKLIGWDLVNYFIEHPEWSGPKYWRGMTPEAWLRLLSKHPELADQCDFSQIHNSYLIEFMKINTDYFYLFNINTERKKEYSTWEKIEETKLWENILSLRPDLIECCPVLDLFSPENWLRLLGKQPFLSKLCPWKKVCSCKNKGAYRSWGMLLEKHIQFAVYCPWDNVFYDSVYWYQCIQKHKEVILKYKPEWKVYTEPAAKDQWEKDFAQHCRYMNLWVRYWKTKTFTLYDYDNGLHLLRNWHFLEHIEICGIEKAFSEPPLYLLKIFPHLVDSFIWQNIPCSEYDITDILANQPQLEEKLMKIFHQKHWESFLQRKPEALLQRDGCRFSASDNTRAFVIAKFWSFEKYGLDSICNNFYEYKKNVMRTPKGVFENLDDCDSATWIIYNKMDHSNALLFFEKQLWQKKWDFVAGVFNLDQEGFKGLQSIRCFSFFLVMFGNDIYLQKYCENIDVSWIRDCNGNTLLHAALLYATYTDVKAMLDKNSPGRKQYDFLISQGCNPDIKNKCGFSCNDLIKIIKEKVCFMERKINNGAGFTQ